MGKSQINNELFDYEKYSNKKTVHMANKRQICSFLIKN